MPNAVKKKEKGKRRLPGETSPNATRTGACADGFGHGPEDSLILILVLVIVGCLLPNKLLDNDDEVQASAKCDPASLKP